MRKRDRKVLGAYIRGAADMLELRDWTFGLAHAPADPGKQATVDIVYGRKLAQIAVCEDFRDLPAEEQRHVIAHELVHCHLESACSMVRSDIVAHLGGPADGVFWAGFVRQIEYGVDALASAVEELLPLIDWPERKR